MAIRILSSENISGEVLIASGKYLSWGTAGATSIEGSTVSNKLQFRTNSTNAVIIDSSQNVGIGNFTNPNDGNLVVKKDGLNTGIPNSLTNASFSEGGGQLKGLTIGYRTDETTAVIAARTATGDIAFMGYDGGWLETARFTNDNKLGIGTNDPDGKVHIFKGSNGATTVGTASDELILENDTDCGLTIRSAADGTGVVSFASPTDHNVGQLYYNHDDDSMVIRTNDAIRTIIGSSGIMYIMGATASTNNSLQLQYNSTAGTAEIYSKSTGGNTTFEFYTSNSGTTTQKFNISSSGDVKITTNGKFLQGVRNTGSAVIDMIGFGAGTDRLQIKGGTSGAAESIAFFDTAGQMATFYNSNLGIGVTNPSQKLEVTGNFKLNGTFVQEGTGNNVTFRYRTGNSNVYTGGNATCKFGRFYWTPAHWSGDAPVIKVTLHSKYYQGERREYIIKAGYQDTDPTINELQPSSTQQKITLLVGATTSAGYNYANQPVYYVDLQWVQTSYMWGWAEVESQVAFLTSNPTSGWGGVVMDSAITQNNLAGLVSNYNSFFAGNVGIGTISPSRTLHVVSDSGVLIKGATGSANGKISFLPASGGRQYDLQNVGSDFRIFDASAGVTRMYFHNNGSIGIGTNSPNSGVKLEVNGIISANGDNSPTGGGLGFGDYQTGGYKWIQSFESQELRINPLGNNVVFPASNVGIGTSSTAAGSQLTLRSSASTGLTILSASNTGECFINFSDNDDANVGQIFYGHSPDRMKFRVGDDTRMTILGSNGNVGIGTDDGPGDVNAKLHVYKQAGDNTVAELLRLDCGENNHNVGKGGAIVFRDINVYTDTAKIIAQRQGNSGGSTLQFALRGSEAMRIQSAGQVCIGTNSTTVSSSVVSAVFGSGSEATLKLGGHSGTHTMIQFFHTGTAVGSIISTTTATTYNTSSDYRLKEDLKDFAGLDMVSKIPVYDFKWKTDESRSYGVMAHELEEVLPQAVIGEKDAEEMQSVDYSKIVPLLVKSIQELKAEVENLKSQKQ